MVKTSTSSVTSKRKKRNGLVLLFIVVGFLAVLGFSFDQNVMAPRRQLDVPERLGDLLLVGTLEGSDAMARVNRLHGTDIGLVSAYIAEYARALNSNRNGDEWLTVWVGGTESPDAAVDLMRRMTEGIERGGSGFSNLQRLTISGHEVFRVAGPGGEHFFYISWEQRERVVWLTLGADDALPILEQAVRNF